MEERKYRYDAFISYRHTELDKFVAENLIKQLEAFKLPRSVAKKLKGKKTKIERVFRDREELPLTNNLEEPIVEALQSSEWLIVICSPRLPESMWCKKEIETFISLRGREHVLAVLIEGEPSESFPEELLYKYEEVKTADGTIERVKVPVEPLAADFRGKDGADKKGVLKAMKTEILRVLAAMFGIPYDDLRQRHRERRMRRIMTASVVIGTACLLFGIYSTMTAMRIKAQKEQIEVQSEQILEQSKEIQAKSEEIQKQNVEITKQNEELAFQQALALSELATGYYEEGDNKNAVKTAVEALTESNGISLPYTPKAQYILTDALRAYDTGASFRAGYQYEMPGKIDIMTISPDKRVVAIHDATGALTLFDLEKNAEIDTLTYELDEYYGNKSLAFLNGNRMVFINSENKAAIYDIEKKAVVGELDMDYVGKMYTDKEARYLYVEGFENNYTIYDADTLELVGTIQKPEADGYDYNPIAFPEGILTDSFYMKGTQDEEMHTLYLWDTVSGQLISSCNMGEKQPKDVKVNGEVVYALSSVYADNYMDCDSYITAINKATGEILWENKLQGLYPGQLVLPAGVGTDMLCITSGSVRLINMQTGEISLVVTLESNVLSANSFTESNNFVMILENGGMSVVSKEYGACYDMSYRLECKSQKNTTSFYTKYGVVMQARNDNKITVYTAKMGEKVKEIQNVMEFPELVEELLGEQAFETARSYGLERPEFVNSLFHSNDGRYAIVRYWDGNTSIYDTTEKAIVSTIENAYTVDWFLGPDANGNCYLLGYEGCYVLNQDMEPIAWIPYVVNVDLENSLVYMKDGDQYFEAPIYTIEDLLQLAKEQ